VRRVTHDVILDLDAVAAVHVARHAGNIECLAAVVALDDRDRLDGQLTLVEHATDAQRALKPERNLGHHVSELLLDELGVSERTIELLAVERVLTRAVEAVLSGTHGAPGDSVARTVEASKRSCQTLHVG